MEKDNVYVLFEEIKNKIEMINGKLLTSSTCHPKFICEQWRNALMAFHQHSSVDCLLVLRQCNLYSLRVKHGTVCLYLI